MFHCSDFCHHFHHLSNRNLSEQRCTDAQNYHIWRSSKNRIHDSKSKTPIHPISNLANDYQATWPSCLMRRKWKIWMREMKKDIQVVPKRAEGGSFMRISHRKTVRVECVQNHQPTHSLNNFLCTPLNHSALWCSGSGWLYFHSVLLVCFQWYCVARWAEVDEMRWDDTMSGDAFFPTSRPSQALMSKVSRDLIKHGAEHQVSMKKRRKKHTPTNKPKKKSWKVWVKHGET